VKTGIVFDRRYQNHNMGSYHVENPQRIKVILDMIETGLSFDWEKITPRAAHEEEILWVHTQAYYDRIRSTAGKERVKLDPDTSTSALSFETAKLAAGGVLQAVDYIQEKKIRNSFVPVRPPGHHAEASRAMGFCLFNNIAIGAEYLIQKFSAKKILIVDWDLHHGNGTQNFFYRRNDVLYFSTHQSPFYPGTGHWQDIGIAAGAGYNINIPLEAGKNDADYIYIFKQILTPITLAYKPEFILVSAGFDIADSDPLGGMQVSTAGFAGLSAVLMDLAEQCCQGKLLLVLEGGYDLEALKQGTKQMLDQLSGTGRKPQIISTLSPETGLELEPAVNMFQKYWPVM